MTNKNVLAVPPPTADLASRLAFCAARLGGKRALATASGFSESQLFRYLNGSSEMSAAKAHALAAAAHVNLDWLMSGAGLAEKPIIVPTHPPFHPDLMEEILRQLNEVFVDFEWRLSPTQRARYATYAYQALRQEEHATGDAEITPERLMEGLWYFGRTTFDELLNVHIEALQRLTSVHSLTAWEHTHHYAQAISQGYYQFYNSTGGDAVNRWLGLQVSESSAQRLLKLITAWRQSNPSSHKWLDIGCGNGRELEYLTRHAPEAEVYGVEIARAALAQCHKFARSGLWPEGNVVEGEATQLPFADATMGLVYCRGVLSYLPWFGDATVTYGLPQALREINRVAAPGALISLVAPLHRHHHLTYAASLSLEGLQNLIHTLGLPWQVLTTASTIFPQAAPDFREQGELLLQKQKDLPKAGLGIR